MLKTTALALVCLSLSLSAEAGDRLRFKSLGTQVTESLSTFAEPLAGHSLFLVQWKSAVKESEKAAVKSSGLQLLQYFPDDAFLAQGTPEAAAAVQKLSFLRVVLPYTAPMKVERELVPQGMAAASESLAVSVQLAPNADKSALAILLPGAVDAGNNILIGRLATANLPELAASAEVLWIERYLPLRSLDVKANELGVAPATGTPSRSGFESGVKILNVDSFYSRGSMTGQGQIVAVADTGLDTGDVNTLNADFQGQLKIGLAMGLGGSSWGDPEMHGTHVSGSILGNGHNSQNLMRGAAYGAQLVMLGMWSDIMNNIMPPSLDKLYAAGYEQGARIQSDSWGSPSSMGRYDNWAALTDTWLFNHPDYLALFAAGNDGADTNRDGVIDEGSVGSPGTAKNVLTVGASKNYLLEGGIQKPMQELRNGHDKWGVEPLASSRLSEDPKGLAAFSSRGPTADGRIKPEIVAPGTNIVSVRDKHPKADPVSMSWGIYDDNYVYMGGTSMATPVAAGGVALVRQYLLKQLGTETVSAALLKATVANGADDLFPGQFGLRAAGRGPRRADHQTEQPRRLGPLGLS